MHDQIKGFIRYQVITDFQSGFRKGFSTQSALTKVSQDIATNIDKKEPTALLLLDFSKAFDSVSHTLLCQKLKLFYMFSNFACTLIAKYLHKRTQRVSIAGTLSDDIITTGSVPQGSGLSPLLFSLFINDLAHQIHHCLYHFFADDVQIQFSARPRDLKNKFVLIQQDLNRISTWCTSNALTINVKKTQAVLIYTFDLNTDDLPPLHIDNEPISFHTKVRNLGVLFNSRLNAKDQTAQTSGRIYGILSSLRSSNVPLPQHTKLTLVKSLIMPHIDYCSTLNTEMHQQYFHRLQVAFNACTRFVFDIQPREHITPYADKILGCTLKTHLEVRHIAFLRKIIITGCPQYLSNLFTFANSRRTQNLTIPRYHSDHMQRSFTVVAIRLWNKLPPQIRLNILGNGFIEQCKNFLAGNG